MQALWIVAGFNDIRETNQWDLNAHVTMKAYGPLVSILRV